MMSISSRIKDMIFTRPFLQPFFRRIFDVSLEAMSIGIGGGNIKQSGEKYALNHTLRGLSSPIVFDIGAQGGDYSKEVLAVTEGRARIYAFEPHTADFETLQGIIGDKTHLFNLALGETEGEMKLYYTHGVHGLSSFHRKDGDSDSQIVKIQTIDRFCEDHDVKEIALLKLDVEGHELACLRGAKEMLPHIRFIQFEMSIASRDARVYFKDIFEYLKDYKIYRILRDGLAEVKSPDRFSEMLFTTNYLAERKI